VLLVLMKEVMTGLCLIYTNKLEWVCAYRRLKQASLLAFQNMHACSDKEQKDTDTFH
jgi:hypothetical protein